MKLKKVSRHLFILFSLSFFIISFLFSGQKIRVREVKIEESKEIFFSKPIDLESTDFKIFVLDSQESVVRSFSVEGKFLASIGRYGRGPGEFVSSTDMSVTRDEVALIDREGQRIQFFSHDGTFRGEFKTSFRPYRLVSLSKDKFIVSRIPRVAEENVFFLYGFDRQGKEIFRSERVSSSGDGAVDFIQFAHCLTAVGSEVALFKNFGPDLGCFFDENGRKTRLLKIDRALPVLQFELPLARTQKARASFWSVSVSDNRIYLVLPGRMEDGDVGPSPRVAVLNLEGKLETVIDFPVTVFRLARIDRRFFIVDDSARLRLFDLIEEKF